MLPPSGCWGHSRVEPWQGTELEGGQLLGPPPPLPPSCPCLLIHRGSSNLSVLFSLRGQTWPRTSPEQSTWQGTFQRDRF